MTVEIKEAVEQLGSTFEQFKKANDARLSEIEKKGSADVLLEAKVAKLNDALDEQKNRADMLEKAINRPEAQAEGEKENSEYKAAFLGYMRKGVEHKALSVNSDPDGGYLVPQQMSAMISKVIFETSPMRQLATVETITSDSLDVMRDAGEFGAAWAGEEEARSESTTSQLNLINIPAYEMYAEPRATQKLLDDSGINAEAWLSAKVADKFARTEATAFVSGNGATQPKGFLAYAAGTSGQTIQQVNSGTSGVVTADGLIDLFYSLKSDYAAAASFLMNRTTVQAVRKLKDTTNQYIWQPALTLSQPDSLLGRPLLMATDMPVAAANSLSVAFGDFKRGYVIADRVGIRTLRDPFTAKPFVKFYTTKRVGGAVVNFEAIKLLKLAA